MRALITGATSGIGKSFAKRLHKRGWELVLTGRNETVLLDMQRKLGNNTMIIPADLSDKDEVFKVYKFCKDKDIDLLVNNAGYGIFGKFDETDLRDEIDMINVNITAMHILAKLFLRDFKKHNRGIIINVASTAGFLAGPLLSSYYASKNYVIRLSLAIAEELRRDRSNVSVTVLCPGPVDTNFNNRAGVHFNVKPISPDYAAEFALRKAFAGQVIAIPKLSMKASIFVNKFLPYRLSTAIVYNIQKAKKKDPSAKAVTE